MSKIFLTSDLHFCHDRAFIYAPRGFTSVQEMNNAIVARWNSIVRSKDTVYVLGDLMLGGSNNLEGLDYICRLNGNIHIIRGNHDTDIRCNRYTALHNVISLDDAKWLKYKKYHFYLSHFPTLTANLEKETLTQCSINLFGHTHSKEKFYNDISYMYNVAVDAHDCYPVELDKIIKDCKAKFHECKELI